MKALSVERSICEGEQEVKKLFEFVANFAKDMTAYQMEHDIFARVMKIGLAAMKAYFATKGTGDVGEELRFADGRVAAKQALLCGKAYFSVFGKFTVPRTAYQSPGRASVMPLDAQVDLPERCYSYLLQEWMDHLSIRRSFKDSELTLDKLLGVHVSASRFEVIDQASVNPGSYSRFYAQKERPSLDEEGAIQVLQFDGKGVPMIKTEAAKLKARPGKGEKRQKKKEALVGGSYTIDSSPRSAEEVARDAMTRDPKRRRPWVVVMDGALGLWAVVAAVLQGISYVGILDIIHVVEYLWNVGNALYGEGASDTQRWVSTHLVFILRGQVGRVIGGLKQTITKRRLTVSQQKAVTQAVQYFTNHRHWMQYDVYLQAGYPIGSGVVESTCGHTVKDRMEGSGRRWSIVGAESTL